MRNDGDLANDIAFREQHAVQMARIAVKNYTPIKTIPERDAAGILLLGYGRRIEERGLTIQESDFLLFNDLRYICDTLRKYFFPLLKLNDVRMSVVIHLAFVFGIDKIRQMKELWNALRNEQYDDAADQMLLSDWPSRVGHTDAERRRAVDLVRMMRTGLLKVAP